MQTGKYLAIGAFLVLASFATFCSAIKCYECNSYTTGFCGEGFNQPKTMDSSILVDCDTLGDHNYTFCRKTVTTASFKPDKHTLRITRSCGWAEEPKLSPAENEDPSDLRCYRRTGTYAVELLYCTCHADACNAASVNGISSAITLCFVALLALMWQE